MPTPNEDPISAASSGLFALGVNQRRRMETLGLLSALIDLADERGEVLLDSSLMDTEERLGIDACLEGYEWLERIGVIRRTWSGWMIQNYDAHHGPVGITEASMVVLQRYLPGADDKPTVVITPEPAEAPVVTAPVVTLTPWRRRVPAIAASVAAGVAVLAGATQFVPQAAVSGRNAAVRTNGTALSAPVGTDSVTSGATSPAAPTTNGAPNVAAPGAAATTTTSTTLLPDVPCVTDVLDDVADRTKLTLRSTPTTQLPPGALPCP